jgi:hypothetical protein
MIKGGIFSLGLLSGVFFGIYLREKGYTSGFTRAYYAYKNEDYLNKNTTPERQQLEKPAIDEMHNYFQKGILTDDRFDKYKEMTYSKNYSKIDEIVIRDPKQLMNSKEFEVQKSEYNAFHNKK